jgi:hypothetical protein
MFFKWGEGQGFFSFEFLVLSFEKMLLTRNWKLETQNSTALSPLPHWSPTIPFAEQGA